MILLLLLLFIITAILYYLLFIFKEFAFFGIYTEKYNTGRNIQKLK